VCRTTEESCWSDQSVLEGGEWREDREDAGKFWSTFAQTCPMPVTDLYRCRVRAQLCYRPISSDREPLIGFLEKDVLVATGMGPWVSSVPLSYHADSPLTTIVRIGYHSCSGIREACRRNGSRAEFECRRISTVTSTVRNRGVMKVQCRKSLHTSMSRGERLH